MSKEKWIWMGHPGHLCIASQCQFRLNTYVNGYIVSTVGEYWPGEEIAKSLLKLRVSRKNLYKKVSVELVENLLKLKGDAFVQAYISSLGFEEIGWQRVYETMVFKAIKSENSCCPYEADVSEEIYMGGYNDSKSAMKGHYKACEMAENGEFDSFEDEKQSDNNF